MATQEEARNLANAEVVIPVVREEATVRKRVVETGGVRVRKTVHERSELIDEPLLKDSVSVERVAIERVVDAPPAVRYEGEILIIPVVEEVLVVQKQLVLREEIRVTRHSQPLRAPQEVTLRSEAVAVERFDGQAPPTGSDHSNT